MIRSGSARSILLSTSTEFFGSRSATKRSPGPIEAFASTSRQATSMPSSGGGRRVVEPLPHQGARLVDARRVDEDDLRLGPVQHAADLVAGRLRLVRDDRDLLAEDLVEQRRLAHVGAADEGHEPGAEALGHVVVARDARPRPASRPGRTVADVVGPVGVDGSAHADSSASASSRRLHRAPRRTRATRRPSTRSTMMPHAGLLDGVTGDRHPTRAARTPARRASRSCPRAAPGRAPR